MSIFDMTKFKLTRKSIDRLQINLGMYCNQACTHCHHQAGPTRTELMSAQTSRQVLDFAIENAIEIIELTGGAPELNPNFKDIVLRAVASGKKVIVRSNLTVIFEDGMEGLPQFYADNKVELICSLPCYTESNVDAQRGSGVFAKSIKALKMLNAIGYGLEGSGLVLDLVYNPGGGFLPGSQKALEADYRRILADDHGIVFNHLLTITNMPLGRFGKELKAHDCFDDYMDLLTEKACPCLAEEVMCHYLVSIGWDGTVYDCDFNQAINLAAGGVSKKIWEIDYDELKTRRIALAPHCVACVAGSGSSCFGSLEVSCS